MDNPKKDNDNKNNNNMKYIQKKRAEMLNSQNYIDHYLGVNE